MLSNVRVSVVDLGHGDCPLTVYVCMWPKRLGCYLFYVYDEEKTPLQ